jgi:hypothetical protein
VITYQTDTKGTINHCYFIDNSDGVLFYGKAASSIISVEDCYIQHSGTLSVGNVLIKITFSDPFSTLPFDRCVFPSNHLTIHFK